MPGTDVAHGATSAVVGTDALKQRVSAYAPAMRFPVLTWRMCYYQLKQWVDSHWDFRNIPHLAKECFTGTLASYALVYIRLRACYAMPGTDIA
eukprot:3887488-Rhodomonas_salina.3